MIRKRAVQPKKRLRDKNYFSYDESFLSERVPQKLLGITEREYLKMFQEACLLLEQKDIDKAVQAFTLLCQLHPYIADCWYGLGCALRYDEKFQEALKAFFMAETIDPTQFEFYKQEIECCLELHDKKEATHIFHRMNAHRKHIEDFAKKQAEVDDLTSQMEAFS